MRPGTIPNSTRILGNPSDMTTEQCGALAVRDEMVEIGADRFQAMTSEWILSPQERQQIAEGHPVRLSIIGGSHPPVILTVAR